jgi:hypothetical protein
VRLAVRAQGPLPLFGDGARRGEHPRFERVVAIERLVDLAQQLAFAEAGRVGVLLGLDPEAPVLAASGPGVAARLGARVRARSAGLATFPPAWPPASRTRRASRHEARP